ncbi:MAG: cupin domain-containing protein [Acetobacteraceae bacterium]|nr:cupin domain-containing protein [Acetobacteraceae bacterium]
MRVASGKGGAGKAGKARAPKALAKPRRGGAAKRGGNGVAHETDALILAIGARLRAIRAAKQMTLLQLAQQTGLSSSMLSLLERGKTAPSIGTLVALGSALGVPTSELLGGPPPPATPAEPVSRLEDQAVYAAPDGVVRRVLRTDPQHGVEIALNEYEPGSASAPRPTTHDGYEFGIAIEGVLEVTLNGEVFTLKSGDLVSYRSTDPHRIANRGRRKARALWVNLRQG